MEVFVVNQGTLANWLVVFAAFGSSLCLAKPALPGSADAVAVLELASDSDRVSVSEVQFLVDEVREAVRGGLDPARFKVMTRETMATLVPPSEMQCLADKCVLEIGQRLQARFVVGGSLKDFSGDLGLTLEAYDTRSGMLLTSQTATAPDVKEARAQLKLLGRRLAREMAKGAEPAPGTTFSAPPTVVGASAIVNGGTITQAVGVLTIQSTTPSRAPVRLEIAMPSGETVAVGSPYRNPQAEAGTWKVVALASGFEDQSLSVAVRPDESTTIKIAEWQALGGLKIAGKGTPSHQIAMALEKQFPSSNGVPSTSATDDEATKVCPMCAETVKAGAKLCRFCRHEFA